MAFVLSSQNVLNYLIQRGICTEQHEIQSPIEPKYAKNFNLLLTLSQGRKLLVKQEPRKPDGETAGEFLREWRVQNFLIQFESLSYLRDVLSAAVDFNSEDSVIVFHYLDQYRDLADFYFKENTFPQEVAKAIGTVLGCIHAATFNHPDYQAFFNQNSPNQEVEVYPTTAVQLVGNLEEIGPEIFGLVPMDGLKFFTLYQRYESLGQAIAEVARNLYPCCLTHNDLKLNNILLVLNWQDAEPANGRSPLPIPRVGNDPLIRLIDWERSGWGDPALDLGLMLGSYLHLWLSSLIVGKSISLDESLRLATTPLDILQPSLDALASAYLDAFPQILAHRPDFLNQVMQCAGISLIQAIQSTLQHQKTFGNNEICMLQVAKSLLCRPQSAIATVFGVESSELLPVSSRAFS